MGSVTQVTRKVQFGSLDKKFDILDTHNDKNGGSGYGYSFPYLEKGRLWGSLTLQDRSANRHAIMFSATRDDSHEHTELALLSKLQQWIEDTEVGLSAAKVAVYVDQSPCTNCAKVLVQRSQDIAELLGKGSGTFEFSYVYSKYYATGQGDDSRHNLHASAAKAATCYATTINGLYRKGSLDCKILVRHIEQTAGGSAKHVSFKTDLP